MKIINRSFYSILLIVVFFISSCSNHSDEKSSKSPESNINNDAANKDRIITDTTVNSSTESGALGTTSNAGKNNGQAPKNTTKMKASK